MRQSSPLFSSFQCGPMTLPNRFIRSATWEGLADSNGFPAQELFNKMVQLAKGGCGLIVPGYCYTIQHGRANPTQTGMTSKEHAQIWKETIDEIHKNGSKIMFQLAHGGDKCNQNDIGQQPIGCSGLEPGSRAMTDAEICETIESFAKAAKYLKEAGADGVQLHAAHGYLLSQFLSPYLNRRTDKWGGVTENRTRIVFEIVNEIRKQPQFDKDKIQKILKILI